MIGPGTNRAHFDAIARIPAGKSVANIKPLARIQIVDGPLAIDDKHRLVELKIDRAPPDVAGARRVVDDAFIERTAPRFRARANHEGPAVGDRRLFMDNSIFVKSGRS